MAAHQALPSLGFSRQEHWSGFVRECLTVGFLCAVSYLSWALCSLSVPDRREQSGKPLPGLRSKRWDSCIRFPSLAFPYGERDYLQPSFDMDCLLALWPLVLLVSLVICKVWSFDLYLNELPCNMVYILTKSSVKHPCSTRDLGLRVLLSLSLCLSFWLISWSLEACWAHFPTLAFKTSQDFLRGHPVPTWAVQALSKVFIGFLHNPGNIST